MMLYRIGNWFYRSKIPLFPKVINLFIRLVHNSAVFSETKIGKGTIFGYGGIAIVIHKNATIGNDCVIGSCVTIGGREGSGVPVIGNNVYIATGAKILGGIHIGDNVKIGANAVVLIDIPDNKTAVGIPARIVH
ncbi:serine acetyltransferase [Pseudoalteromonas sp. SCSIO 43095]|uniref:serine O-acetyltransferase n=1 Tax=Pseudoalteromonas sp. SCSIO 43095 TaxID=2894202 RepID=UPI00202B1BCA|nr:serine acetyltransferase [Pseudoalteromonas sp. SCSIO 43095]URQ97582.1 serine acetyltransferase [Pseudoalteromonas sp. SCSIO 43095]